MTLNKLIKKILELKSEGYGEKQTIFDNTYFVSGAYHNTEDDVINIY